PDSNNKFITTYFRRTFNLASPSSITNLLVRLLRDDGAVAYLNDTEVFRSNMDTGSITYTNLALAGASDDGTVFFQNPAPANLLVSGANVVAVEVHQNAGTSTDLSFDLEIG